MSVAHVHIGQAHAIDALLLSVVSALVFARQVVGPRQRWSEKRSWSLVALCGAIMGCALLFYLALFHTSYVTPDISTDGTTYHIPTMQFWAQEGRVHWITELVQRPELLNGYPKASELLAYTLATATHDSHLINTTNLLFLPLGVIGIASLGHSLGARPLLAIVAGTLFMFAPTNIMQANSTYVDCSYASCAIAVLALAFELDQRLLRGEPAASLPLVLGAASGLAIGTKSTGLALVLLTIAGVGYCVWLGHHGRPRLVAVIKTLMVMASVCCIVGGYWYVRNWVIKGSPLYPVGVSILGHQLFPGASTSAVILDKYNTPPVMQDWPRILQVLFTWLQGLDEWPTSIAGTDARLGGLGYLWVLACLPAIIYCIFHRADLPQPPFIILLAVVLLAFIVTPMNWWARYTLWIYGLGLPCLAKTGDDLVRSSSLPLAKLWLAACVVIAIGEGVLAYSFTWPYIYPHPWPPSSIKELTPAYFSRSPLQVFPELQGSKFERVLESPGVVVLGQFQGQVDTGAYKLTMLGLLSQPIGYRTIVPVRTGTDYEAYLRAGGRLPTFAVWDSGSALPTELTVSATSISSIGGFWLVEYQE